MVTPSRSQRALGAAWGTSADLLLGEPPVEPHPVRAFGTLMGRVERTLYRDDQAAGVAYAATGLAVGIGAGLLVRSTAAATYLSVAQRALGRAAGDVEGAVGRDDLEAARRLLPAVAGRDPHDLDGSELIRAAVESVAENTVDAVVAPALWGAVGGACGTLAYRAVNTMDAMVGYRNERYRRFGWASARLDDLAGYVPARATAVLVALARPRAAPAVWRTVRRDAGSHPSPNAGVAEAAFAAALDLRLGGTNRYGGRVEERAPLGTGRPPAPGDVADAVTLCRDVTVLLAAILALMGWLGARR